MQYRLKTNTRGTILTRANKSRVFNTKAFIKKIFFFYYYYRVYYTPNSGKRKKILREARGGEDNILVHIYNKINK